MSYLSDLKSKYPLTPKKLTESLETLAAALDGMKVYTVDKTLLANILAKSEGAVITSVMSAAQFNEIHDKIKDGYIVRLLIGDAVYTATAAYIHDVASDNYKAFDIEIIGKLKTLNGNYLHLGCEMISNSIRLYAKSVKTI